MPEKRTLERAHRDAQQGKAPSTQAGEFVREEMQHHIREGKHGAASTKQAIAIGLSKARRAGVMPPPRRGRVSEKTRRVPQAPIARDSAGRKRRPGVLERGSKRCDAKAAAQRRTERFPARLVPRRGDEAPVAGAWQPERQPGLAPRNVGVEIRSIRSYIKECAKAPLTEELMLHVWAFCDSEIVVARRILFAIFPVPLSLGKAGTNFFTRNADN